MKLLLNDKEIINFLVNCIDHLKAAKSIEFDARETSEQVNNWIEKQRSNKKFDPVAAQRKLKDKLENAVKNDAKVYKNNVNEFLKRRKKYYYDIINKRARYFIEKFGEETILELYKKSTATGFIKGVGLQIDPSATLAFRRHFDNVKENCLMRNTVGNEQVIVQKIDGGYPFWFIDSGYTNFLETHKKWHRIVCNHIHQGNLVDVPVDRLSIFKSFPKQWKTGGSKILVIEPGQFAAAISHIDIKTWKQNVEAELRKYTDKEIVFREKAPKKQRAPLYQHLLKNDYYCVVSINSNAAVEAIWAGIPVITLEKHISTPVSRNKLSDINNLYRGPLAAWLAMLSYSQFTYDELIDGTAVNIVKKYHA